MSANAWHGMRSRCGRPNAWKNSSGSSSTINTKTPWRRIRKLLRPETRPLVMTNDVITSQSTLTRPSATLSRWERAGDCCIFPHSRGPLPPGEGGRRPGEGILVAVSRLIRRGGNCLHHQLSVKSSVLNEDLRIEAASHNRSCEVDTFYVGLECLRVVLRTERFLIESHAQLLEKLCR